MIDLVATSVKLSRYTDRIDSDHAKCSIMNSIKYPKNVEFIIFDFSIVAVNIRTIFFHFLNNVDIQ